MLFLALLPWSAAELPLPTYPECGEPDQPELCPSDLGEDWEHISYVPAHARESVREAELEFGSGNRVDRAWRTTTGRWEAIIAVADSGIEWENDNLINKIFINTGEMPLPQNAKGEESDSYDHNGDGLVNVQDWAEDPRVEISAGRDVADEVLDASDLIYTFSDSVDDDGNGYVDDIAGWDFFGHDNDPYADFTKGFGDHGTGVMREAGSEGGDGGNIGVCPNCAILPIRAGDTFITDGSRVAESVVFATDSDAVVVVIANGALSNADATTSAVAYAFENDVLVAGVTGDENSYHHNFPAVLDDALYLHSITHNTPDDDGDVYSYMNTWNCNNFGARLDLVAASAACATGSAAVIGGVVGLLHSAAWDQGLTLTSGEVYQLMTQTATDVWLTEDELEESGAYPSHEGWDPFYGYGRVDVASAVERIVDGDIPPSVSVTEPAWFETFCPAQTGTVDIRARLSADRSESFVWTLEYGLGHDPIEWSELSSGSGGEAIDGVLGTLDLSDIPVVSIPEADYDEGIIGRLERVNRPAVTVRVTITDDAGRVGQRRKTFFVHTDPDLLPGFPIFLNGSGESSPLMVDMDGDDIYEVVIGDGSGRIHAFTGSGEELPGWPVTSDVLGELAEDAVGWGEVDLLHDAFLATVAAGDIDGDGLPEVVGAGLSGGLYAWHADGTEVAGFPVFAIGRTSDEFDGDHTYDQGFAGAPTLYDLDGDGSLEIIAAAMDQRLYVFNSDGSNWGPYPIEVCEPTLCGEVGTRIISSPAIGDVDNDGDPDIALGTNEAANNGTSSVAHLIDATTGESLPGWPHLETGLVAEAVLLPLIGEGHPSSMAMADLDGDQDLELFNAIMLGTTNLLHHTAETALEISYYETEFGPDTNADVPSIIQFVTNPAFGDLDGDGVPDPVIGGGNTLYLLTLAMRTHMEYQQAAIAWSGADGSTLPGWPRQIEDVQFIVAPAIADLSGDGKAEAVLGSGGYLLHAWDSEGNEPEGWPKFTGNWILGSPAVGDIDGDGYLEVAVSTREGWLFVWRTAGHADQDIQWQSIHHDAQNTGNYEMPLPTQAGPVLEEAGCCSGRNKETAAAWMLFPLGLGMWRRRRSFTG